MEEGLERFETQQRKPVTVSELEEILHLVDWLPVLDSCTPDEILGYDEHGLPL